MPKDQTALTRMKRADGSVEFAASAAGAFYSPNNLLEAMGPLLNDLICKDASLLPSKAAQHARLYAQKVSRAHKQFEGMWGGGVWDPRVPQPPKHRSPEPKRPRPRSAPLARSPAPWDSR